MSAPAAGRLITLDAIRGVAVMGIFSVNVIGMAMIEAAYFNPPAFGFDGIWDRIVWAANFILVDHKFRSLFSILFGASMLLVIDRAEASGRSAATTHFARMAVLLLLGVAHFYFIWWGDILVLYALVGAIAFGFRKFDVRALVLTALMLFAWDNVPRILRAPAWQEDYAAAHRADPAPNAFQQWRERSDFFEPSSAQLAADASVHGSYRAYAAHSLTARRWEPIDGFATLWAETLALMLLGMAGLRSGFLSGGWSDRAYRHTALLALGIGALAYAVLAARTWQSGFRLPEVITGYLIYARPFGPIMALGYAAAILLIVRRPGWIRDRLAAVGRAAFSNYIGSSLAGLAVFVGLGWYGQLSRAEAWLLVPLVWALMLAWSKPWLDRFAYGPLEWLWRSLARSELQPMRRSAPGS